MELLSKWNANLSDKGALNRPAASGIDPGPPRRRHPTEPEHASTIRRSAPFFDQREMAGQAIAAGTSPTRV